MSGSRFGIRQAFVSLLFVGLSELVGVAHALPAFPGAEGYGSETVGGSGRNFSPPYTRIFKVKSKNDSGRGTLRECVEASGPRTCLFEVSGRIKLKRTLKFIEPFITIAGETAPSPGILLTGAGLEIRTHDVLARHFEVRVGDDRSGPDPQSRDGIAILGAPAAYNIVLDHLSVSWAVDEVLSTAFANTNDITVSNSILAEGLWHSIHPDGPHSMGVLIGEYSQRITLHRNLLTHNDDRNPYIQPGSSVELVNNVIYNWGGTSPSNALDLSDYAGVGAPSYLMAIANIYQLGLAHGSLSVLRAEHLAPGSQLYFQGNITPLRPTNEYSEWAGAEWEEGSYKTEVPPLWSETHTVPLPAEITRDAVLLNVGSRPRERSAVDRRIVDDVRRYRGDLKDCVAKCARNAGGWPNPRSKTRRLSLPRNPLADSNGNGYTDLEDWIHSFTPKVEW